MNLYRLVRTITIICALLFAAVQLACAASAPKYVFYFIGDGMGMGPVLATEYYNRMVENSHERLLMLQFPTVGWCQTYSASSSTTDSAAAGTALATGHKTRNGMIGMDADSIPVKSVASSLHEDGWGVALVTSVAADDATPAAFYAHVPNRHQSRQIDLDAAASGFEFIAGAGLKGLDSDHHDEVAQALNDAGVRIAFGRNGLDSLDARRVVLLNVERGRTWNVGYLTDNATGLTLPEMTAAALKHLQQHTPDKFFMMVEGGNIDHALHANDGGTAIREIFNFNDALRIAYDFYLQHPDETLIIVTADHDTGGMAMGNNTVGYGSNFGNLRYQHRSKEVFSEQLKGLLAEDALLPTWEEMKATLSKNLGLFSEIAVSEEQEKNLKDIYVATFETRTAEGNKTLYANFDGFAEAVYKLFNNLAGYGFTSNHHTGNPVPLTAIGVGSDSFNALNDNTDIPAKILQLTR